MAGARPPMCSEASAACCAAPLGLHLFLEMEPLVPAVLHIAYYTPVSHEQLSECSRVIGIRGSALYQSFFSTIQKYSRNRERERAKQLSFSVSVSLTHTHTLTHKHELENTDEQLSGQRIQFCDPTISSIFSAYTSKHKHSSRCTTRSLLTL